MTLPDELAAELAALAPALTTVESRATAINRGIRARYNNRLNGLPPALRMNIGTQIGNQCDAFVAELLPPADSGLHVGYPRK